MEVVATTPQTPTSQSRSTSDRPSANRPTAVEWRDVRFAYAPASDASHKSANRVLDGASLAVAQGEFCLLTGGTGAGKTTLLRMAKPEVAPNGSRSGDVLVMGRDVAHFSAAESAGTVGYVAQVPSTQIVCDSVWHELAFGLESLGMPQAEMHRRVAEVCYFLGLDRLFRRRTDELSGGEQQLVALASVLAMEPRVLLLDEPTSMLDPIARDGFAHALFRLNRELGITVVVATHEPWALADYATCAARVADGRVERVDVANLRVEPSLSDVAPASDAAPAVPAAEKGREAAAASPSDALALTDAWARYGRDDPWVLEGCSLACSAGSVHALVGGNGSGKSTILRVAAGILRPSRGRVRLGAPDVRDGCAARALLPQDPEALLPAPTVLENLMSWSGIGDYGEGDASAMLDRLGLAPAGDYLARDPMDLSGGQRQLVALAKVLLVRPALLLADEPTMGLDVPSRRIVARELRGIARSGSAVLLATHDLTLAREVADVTSMVFDGGVTCTMPTAGFFGANVFFR